MILPEEDKVKLRPSKLKERIVQPEDLLSAKLIAFLATKSLLRSTIKKTFYKITPNTQVITQLKPKRIKNP